MSELNAWDGLRLLADWFDARIPNDTNPEVQASLRVWAQDFIDLRRQLETARAALAQRDERIKELEADFVAVAPVVRAAIEFAHVDSYYRGRLLKDSVRDLPADVRERITKGADYE